MNLFAKRVASLAVSLSLIAMIATSASAGPRVPQVPVAGGGLQGYLTSQGETINVLTDQDEAQTWASTVASNATFTLQIELSAIAGANAVGIHNGGDAVPALYQVFPPAATAGWFATASFRTGPVRLIINLFDNFGVHQGGNTYFGADRDNFGFYLDGPGGFFWTQDARNPGGLPQALTFAGTGANSGSWWLAFEDQGFVPGASDFDDAVLFLEAVNPSTPVQRTSWGQLKARFR